MHQDKWVDLHIHSTCSDGRNSPREVVVIAAERGLAAVSLADHDSLEGYLELTEAANETGIECVSGIELSCVYCGKDLHVLGYGVDIGDASFQSMLTQFRDTREKRGLKIVEKLKAIDIHIDVGPLLEKAGKGSLGRPHIADALVAGGYVNDFSEAFEKYIGENCPAYVEKFKLTPEEAIAHIRASGGLAFVAHAGYYIDYGHAFYELLDCGFDGIEIYHPKHTNSVTKTLSKIAEERGFLVSGGSDYHGFSERDNVGEPKVPYELFDRIKSRLREVNG
jgi:predicted metal-dependent phosphoesterase TrpH